MCLNLIGTPLYSQLYFINLITMFYCYAIDLQLDEAFDRPHSVYLVVHKFGRTQICMKGILGKLCHCHQDSGGNRPGLLPFQNPQRV